MSCKTVDRPIFNLINFHHFAKGRIRGKGLYIFSLTVVKLQRRFLTSIINREKLYIGSFIWR